MPDETSTSITPTPTPTPDVTPTTVETVTTTTTVPAGAVAAAAAAATATPFKVFLTKHLLWCKNWVTTHGGWTHVGTVGILGCGFGYAFFPPFTHMFDWIWSILPHWLKEAAITISAFYAWIRNPRTKAAWKALVASQTTQVAADGTTTVTTKVVSEAPASVAAALAAASEQAQVATPASAASAPKL